MLSPSCVAYLSLLLSSLQGASHLCFKGRDREEMHRDDIQSRDAFGISAFGISFKGGWVTEKRWAASKEAISPTQPIEAEMRCASLDTLATFKSKWRTDAETPKERYARFCL
jgi:hypothetical protein